VNVKIAISFGLRYERETHPIDPRIGPDRYVVFEGEDYPEARAAAFEWSKGRFAFDYLYEVDGVPSIEFQRVRDRWGWTELEIEDPGE
jgi:hypothetical protein